MSIGGWILMGLTVSGIVGLLGWCMVTVLKTPRSPDHMHSPIDIRPDDQAP